LYKIRSSRQAMTNRILRRFGILGGLSAFVWMGIWWSLGLYPVSAAVGALVCIYAIVFFLHDRISLRVASNVLLGATFLALMVPIVATGGVSGRIVFWLAVVPVGCALLRNMRDALVWSGLAIGAMLLLWMIELQGLSPPMLVPPHQHTLLNAISDVTVFIVMAGLAILATDVQEQARRRVEGANAELEQTAASLRDQNQLLEALVETGARQRLKLEVETLLQDICNSITESLGWRYVLISLRDYDAGTTRAVAVAGYEPEMAEKILRGPPAPIVVGERWLRDENRISNSYFISHRHVRDHEADSPIYTAMQTSAAEADAWHPDDILLVPLISEERVLGFISPDDPVDGRRPSLRRVRALELFANQAAVAIELARLFETLRARTVELEVAYAELRQSQEHLLMSEKMAALGRVTAGIAHEINSPLGGILNALQLARELTLEYQRSIDDAEVTREDHLQIAAELAESLALAERAVSRVGQFVRSIKQQTRAQKESGEEAFDLAEETEMSLQMLMHLFVERGVVPVASVERELRIRGDASRYTLVLQNLLTNAIDAYGEGGGEIHVRARRDAGWAVLEVQDFGAGIPDEIRGRVFEYLFTTKDIGRGTGLGLSIVHDLVTSHFAGEVDFDSVPNEGTTFRVRMPLLS
jgi:signal transduction histidine kinase